MLKNSERVEGELVSAELKVKYHSRPKRCYIQMIQPNKGAELFYQEGNNQNQAVYIPPDSLFLLSIWIPWAPI